MACATGLVCSAGVCGTTCSGSSSKCDSAGQSRCALLDSDNQNCGACGNACTSGSACVGGRCDVTCSAGLTRCTASVASTDAGSGDAGDASASADASVPDSGTAPVCVNTQVDNSNCGGCNVRCQVGQTCNAGACEAAFPGSTTPVPMPLTSCSQTSSYHSRLAAADFAGNLYMGAICGGVLRVATSRNGGVSFSAPTTSLTTGLSAAALAAGSVPGLVHALLIQSTRTVMHSVSTDYGATWSTAQQIGPIGGATGSLSGTDQASLAVDGDYVYVQTTTDSTNPRNFRIFRNATRGVGTFTETITQPPLTAGIAYGDVLVQYGSHDVFFAYDEPNFHVWRSSDRTATFLPQVLTNPTGAVYTSDWAIAENRIVGVGYGDPQAAIIALPLGATPVPAVFTTNLAASSGLGRSVVGDRFGNAYVASRAAAGVQVQQLPNGSTVFSASRVIAPGDGASVVSLPRGGAFVTYVNGGTPYGSVQLF